MTTSDTLVSSLTLGPGLRSAATPLTVRWLGTAGFSLECEGHVVLVDPYVTRASLPRVVATRLSSDAGAISRILPHAHAIVTGHTHFDHVLDVPAIALATGGRVFGSRSAVTLCRAAGVPSAQLHDVERGPGSPPACAEVGPFHLRFLPSAHSPLLLGRVPFPGDIRDCDEVPMRAERYRCGAVFAVEIQVAGRTVVHLGSANLVDSAPFPRHVDLALVCVAGWTTSERFVSRLARAFDAERTLLSHWDDFFRPLSAPVRPLPALELPRFVETLHRECPDTRVGTLPLLGELHL